MSLAIWKNLLSLFLMHLSRALSDYQFPSQQKSIQERKMKANWKREIWSESSIKELTTAWRRMEEIICFVDVTDQKLLISHGLCTAKCSQGECFSSLSLSKPEWMGHSPANIARIKMGFSCPDRPSTFLSVAGEKVLEKVLHKLQLRRLHNHSCLLLIVPVDHWNHWWNGE